MEFRKKFSWEKKTNKRKEAEKTNVKEMNIEKRERKGKKILLYRVAKNYMQTLFLINDLLCQILTIIIPR